MSEEKVQRIRRDDILVPVTGIISVATVLIAFMQLSVNISNYQRAATEVQLKLEQRLTRLETKVDLIGVRGKIVE